MKYKSLIIFIFLFCIPKTGTASDSINPFLGVYSGYPSFLSCEGGFLFKTSKIERGYSYILVAGETGTGAAKISIGFQNLTYSHSFSGGLGISYANMRKFSHSFDAKDSENSEYYNGLEIRCNFASLYFTLGGWLRDDSDDKSDFMLTFSIGFCNLSFL